MRDGMPRAYLRIDPNLDQTHPDGLEGFVRLLCVAARQPERGRFRSRAVLEHLMGRVKVRAFYQRGDVSDLPDGRAYVVGWDEWQEGDFTVGDRMRRLRSRRQRDATVTPPSPDRTDVTTDAVLSSNTSLGDDVDVLPPDPPPSGGNPRANGTNPRAIGDAAKKAEAEERELIRRASMAIHQRYLRGEINQSESDRLNRLLAEDPGEFLASVS